MNHYLCQHGHYIALICCKH